ncbi:MAG: penicillin-binding protein 2 [Parcubacteria group bacterium Gr01-1014_30]|nr:MAG: penicillin-binding protein 2 [Parcubacteria group bacterium Gr01-1014_30]
MLEFHLLKELNGRKVKTRFAEHIEPQEVLLDSLAKKKAEQMGIPEMKLETPLSRNVLKAFLLVGAILLGTLFFKSFQLQVIEGKEYSLLSERNKFTFQKIAAQRGVIYDSKGRQLVWNKPSFDLILDKTKLSQDALGEVSGILQKDVRELEQLAAESAFGEVLIARNIPLETLIVLEAKIDDLEGFSIQNNTVRDYRGFWAFSHLIGYMGKINKEEFAKAPDVYTISDWVGRVGLEHSYESVLRKNPGKIRVERDALGNVISQEVSSLPEPGNSLVLWLDAELQEKLREELDQRVRDLGARAGVGVALDPKTGGILAMVSLPDFDASLFQQSAEQATAILQDPREPLFNRVISGKYLTGSTIKPFIASAALQEQIISPQKQIYSSGAIEIPHRYNPEIVYTLRDHAVHGWVDMRKAIAQSSNVYFYTVGGGFGDQKGLGPTKIKEYLNLFGWSEKTGIDLPGEAQGFVPDPAWKRATLGEGWWDGDTYFLSIGQQYLQITPLEVVSAFASIANGGKLMQPRVVKEVVDRDKNILERFEPQVIRENFISPENLEIVRQGMRQAVTGVNSPLASSVALNSLPVSAAAKTGTAELGNDYFNNWVTVFTPYEDPQIVITIMLENVKGVQAAALPVAKEVLQWYFAQE